MLKSPGKYGSAVLSSETKFRGLPQNTSSALESSNGFRTDYEALQNQFQSFKSFPVWATAYATGVTSFHGRDWTSYLPSGFPKSPTYTYPFWTRTLANMIGMLNLGMVPYTSCCLAIREFEVKKKLV